MLLRGMDSSEKIPVFKGLNEKYWKCSELFLVSSPTYPENFMKIRLTVFSVMLLTDRQTDKQTKQRTTMKTTETLKGHRIVWKIEICYLIRMTEGWKRMSSGWHNNIVVTHPDAIAISAKSPGWHMTAWYVIRMTYCSVQKSSGWDTARC